MNAAPLPATLDRPVEKTSGTLQSIIQPILLFFLTLFPITLIELILHEGGHAIDNLMRGSSIDILYVHPFSFSGYVRPFANLNRGWADASGPVVSLSVALIIFLFCWRKRSLSTLPVVLLFPWMALKAGFDERVLFQG